MRQVFQEESAAVAAAIAAVVVVGKFAQCHRGCCCRGCWFHNRQDRAFRVEWAFAAVVVVVAVAVVAAERIRSFHMGVVVVVVVERERLVEGWSKFGPSARRRDLYSLVVVTEEVVGVKHWSHIH